MTLHVAPNGNDNGQGTETDPLSSLAGARDRIRGLETKTGDKIRVLFRGGTYRFTQTVIFDTRDSAPQDGAISFEAYPGEKPVFSAGIPLTDWRKLGEGAQLRTPRPSLEPATVLGSDAE